MNIKSTIFGFEIRVNRMMEDGTIHTRSYSEGFDSFDLVSREDQARLLLIYLNNLRWEIDQKIRPTEFPHDPDAPPSDSEP
jgi:hypothetical protein